MSKRNHKQELKDVTACMNSFKRWLEKRATKYESAEFCGGLSRESLEAHQEELWEIEDKFLSLFFGGRG